MGIIGKSFYKKIVSIVVMGLMLGSVMTLGGCSADQEGADKTVKIGVSVYDQYDTFISQLTECFQGNQGDNVEIVVYNASQSQQTQNSQVRKMVESGCDVICINLVDRTDPTTVIDIARKADVPIIFFNRELVEGDINRWSKLYYVGADASESGMMEGQLAGAVCKIDQSVDKNGDGMIQYVVLEGEAGHQDSIVRTEYSVNTMIEMGVSLDKVGYAIANWNRAQAQTKMTQLIDKCSTGIELVLANNDDMALGAIDAYETSGMLQDKWPVFFGVDGIDTGLEAVKNGKLLGTVYNDKEGQAKAMYDLAMTLAGGGSIEDLSEQYKIEDDRYIRIPYQKVTSTNVNKFLK